MAGFLLCPSPKRAPDTSYKPRTISLLRTCPGLARTPPPNAEPEGVAKTLKGLTLSREPQRPLPKGSVPLLRQPCDGSQLVLTPWGHSCRPHPHSSGPNSRPFLAPGKEHFRYLKVAIRK